MNSSLILIGGGGHCKSVLDSLLKSEKYSKIGIVDKKINVGKCILNIPIIGSDDDLYELHRNGYNYAFITIGSVGDPSLRIKLFNTAEKISFQIPNIIDSTAVVSKYVNLGTGIYIGKNTVVNVGTSIGKGVIINTSSVIEHDCVLGNFTHIAPGAVLCGEVRVAENTHIGANSVVKQQLKIGSNTIIGIGSVVVHNLDDNILAYGNPCEEVCSK